MNVKSVKFLNLFERMEFASVRVDVVLVDLVGEDEELVLVSELDDILDVLPETRMTQHYLF